MVYDLTNSGEPIPSRVTDREEGQNTGFQVIMKHAGGDATAAFDSVHPRDIIDRVLPADRFVGELEPGSAGADDGGGRRGREKPRRGAAAEAGEGKPALGEMLNLFDFEAAARRVMSREGWAYYSSGTEDEIGMRENRAAFQRVWLKPRVLVDVSRVDTSTRVLGYPSSLPVYITATALGKVREGPGPRSLCSREGARPFNWTAVQRGERRCCRQF
ncbi:MAG: FMN-dependent dehydrogenase-domain-containing protein [Olpidium bornovanus]|uniref:FMN-dependent dehydrogenase-domain-containing protein n=1 Tax=Olpidium bornovanus TaxID=278681 RepID=A0A8H7ZP17_9FUNG|nr:MAG: FMN-dependent dehydrogenase-domain-containing protein [Olpidium bornovanus]